ncbi:Aste57867_17425 [Aphanomyces stellatus]|uniref:Aste57867_17425 protein n=1 Tax=Aphanomyces stellatus TaxID=120398 RepID=A0A485L8M1_9STRA|nr:hypothetical protein As57867_017365 [Aphanomyces stellatus]VFT94181.1 Aste57867_17425 [Aphanomyces stellatus]
MQHTDLNTIEAAIVSLRHSDGCSVPWIFSQYCFVDFDQRWHMANSATRQARCQAMVANGAVFLEPALRNIDFNGFHRCWGTAFDVAIASEVKSTDAGRSWLATIQSHDLDDIPVEVAYWQKYNVARFETQWQNFKRIGLVNMYSVSNMFGTPYPFTLQYQNSSFRMHKATSLKMYWGLANDFVAISHNTSGIGGRSLVRSSPVFAFANTSLESVLRANGTLKTPLGNALTLVATLLGPFGSVDMHYVPCPLEATHAVEQTLLVLRRSLRRGNHHAQEVYREIVDPLNNVGPAPKLWNDLGFAAVGGNVLCGETTFASAFPISYSMTTLTSWDIACDPLAIWANFYLTRETVVVSALLSNLTSFDMVTLTCAQNSQFEQLCLQYLNQSIAFIGSYVPPPEVQALEDAIGQATAVIQALEIQLIQYGMQDATSPLQLHQLNILDKTQVEFAFFAWTMLVDWTLGAREVVAFEGDAGSLALLTEYLAPLKQPVNMGENRVNFSFYLRGAVLYITGVMIGLAALVLFYSILCRGSIEHRNVTLLQRVGALVWVGRPLLFVRSLTAIGLLSTSALELQSSGHVSYFVVPSPPVYKTVLSANEVTWMVATVNDMAILLTRKFAYDYSYLNSVMVLVATAILSLTKPVEHSMTMHKQCSLAHMDFQVVCHSGTLTIGLASRVVVLVAIVLTANVVSYLITRVWFYGRPPPPVPYNAIFLYAGAKYLFQKRTWVVDDVYYMDRMSAVLNGILTVKNGGVLYCLDIKLWRTFLIDLPDGNDDADDDVAHITQNALPIPSRGIARG